MKSNVQAARPTFAIYSAAFPLWPPFSAGGNGHLCLCQRDKSNLSSNSDRVRHRVTGLGLLCMWTWDRRCGRGRSDTGQASGYPVTLLPPDLRPPDHYKAVLWILFPVLQSNYYNCEDSF